MSYRLCILPRAERQLAALDKTTYEIIKSKIAELAANPRPPGCKKLKNRHGWRVRTGSYRILYEIDDHAKMLVVQDIGHRREVYR